MIDDLLTMERLDRRGRRARGPVVVDVQGVLEQAIDREKLALERARCPVTVIRKEGLTSARGAWDCPYLLRVFGNLLRNAAHQWPVRRSGSPWRGAASGWRSCSPITGLACPSMGAGENWNETAALSRAQCLRFTAWGYGSSGGRSTCCTAASVSTAAPGWA